MGQTPDGQDDKAISGPAQAMAGFGAADFAVETSRVDSTWNNADSVFRNSIALDEFPGECF
jgi:hypothetical protein